jgi:hypothetical protein
MPLELVHVHAQDMDASILTLWLTFKKGRGEPHLPFGQKPMNKTMDRQMNMDYSVCEAFSRVKAVKKVLYTYDIGCEWCQNFLHRVHASKHLHLREDLEVATAVGKFHLGAHIWECFPLFSLNFVCGAGQLDGEILETSWSSLNKVAENTRGSQAHRQEVLDNHMNDSNGKKQINSGVYQFQLIAFDIHLIPANYLKQSPLQKSGKRLCRNVRLPSWLLRR